MEPTSGNEQIAGKTARPKGGLVLALAAYTAFLLFFRLGARSITDADEVRDALTSHAMVATGDWWTPHFDGLPQYSKPPLFYWLTGLSLKVFGSSRWAIRILPAIFGAACVAAIAATGARLYGGASGLWSGFIVATTIPFVFEHGARTGVMDSLLLALLAGGFYALVRSLERPGWLLGAAALFGLASMTKNLSGLPAAAAGAVFLFRRGRWRAAGRDRIAAAAVILAVLSFGWIAAMEIAHPREFGRIFFGKELVQRSLQTGAFARGPRPRGVLAGLLASARMGFRGFAPWSFFLPLVAWREIRRLSRDADDASELPLLWLSVMAAILAVVRARFPWYLYLVEIPLALPVGRTLAEAFAGVSSARLAWAAAVSFVAGILFFPVNFRYDPGAVDAMMSSVRTVYLTPRLALSLSAAAAAAVGLAILVRRWPRRRSAAAAVSIVLLAGVCAALPLRFAGSRSGLDRLFSAVSPAGKPGPGGLVLWRPPRSTFLFDHSVDWCLIEYGGPSVSEIRSAPEMSRTLSDPSVRAWVVPESEALAAESAAGVRMLARADLAGVGYVALGRDASPGSRAKADQ